MLNNSFFPVSNQAGFTQDQLSIKGDQQISDAHRINGSYVWVDRPRNLIDQGGVWDFNDPLGGPLSRARLQHVQTWYGRSSWSSVAKPTPFSITFRLGFNRQRNPSTSVHTGENGVAALGLQGYSRDYNFPEINFGTNDRVNFPTLGYQANDVLAGKDKVMDAILPWIKGNHSMRMGVNWRRTYMRSRDVQGPANINFGQAQTGLPGFNQTGHGFASMLLGEVSGSSVSLNSLTGLGKATRCSSRTISVSLVNSPLTWACAGITSHFRWNNTTGIHNGIQIWLIRCGGCRVRWNTPALTSGISRTARRTTLPLVSASHGKRWRS
ncbi:MAG: hypothetical protein U5J83_06070 [Bryobacterales bacterium]|nr:hypothetical protein [Bryobacterales bacterium]